ncbi:MAG: hypothetical protein KBF71_05335 [Alphaproteobacteria bacterium]|jgi:hypothetical protein|nr:hypothetical protein [Alphaproteobacteria bacterium]
MKAYRDFMSAHFKSLNRTLLLWPMVLFLVIVILFSFIEKKTLDQALDHQISASLLLYEHFSFVDTSREGSPLSFYLKKNDQYADPSTGAKKEAPPAQESTIRYVIQKSQPNKSGQELIVSGDRFSLYGTYALKMANYIPIFIMLYIASLFLYKDLDQFWIKRYNALFVLLKDADKGHFTRLVRSIPHDYLRGLLFALNRSVISLNELYVSLNGWIKELKDLNLSPQINRKVDQINQTLQKKYHFKGEKIHLSFITIPISPSYFMLFLLTFSEGFFIPFFNYYFVQNIKSSFLTYFMALLTIFFAFSLYSLFQRKQSKSMIFILLCLYLSILGKISLGYSMISDQQVIIFYALSFIGQILAIGLYLFYLFRPFEIAKTSLYVISGALFGLLTGWILQTNELAVHALLGSVYCTYLAILYFFFIPAENHT